MNENTEAFILRTHTPPPNPSETPLTAICGLCGEYYGAHSNGGGFCPVLDESGEYAGFSKEQKFYTEQERIAALERRATPLTDVARQRALQQITPRKFEIHEYAWAMSDLRLHGNDMEIRATLAERRCGELEAELSLERRRMLVLEDPVTQLNLFGNFLQGGSLHELRNRADQFLAALDAKHLAALTPKPEPKGETE